MLETTVPRTTRLSEMALRGKPAVIYDRRSPGSRAYFNLADELLQRYCQSEDTMGLVEGSSIPDRVDPLGPEAPADDSDPVESSIMKAAAEDGLERFLTDLGSGSRETRSLPSGLEPPTPEIVSLDDLLAEEENRGHQGPTDESWDDDVWNTESDGGERVN
jgi:hypothetical protein